MGSGLQVVGVAQVCLVLIRELDAPGGLNLSVWDVHVSSMHRGHGGENGTHHIQQLNVLANTHLVQHHADGAEVSFGIIVLVLQDLWGHVEAVMCLPWTGKGMDGYSPAHTQHLCHHGAGQDACKAKVRSAGAAGTRRFYGLMLW